MRLKQLFWGGFLLSGLFTVVYATTGGGVDPRREQMRQEADAVFAEIDRALTGILQKANLNQRPAEGQVQDAAALLETNRRFAPIYDSPERAVYLLLQGWVSYYQDDPVGNMNWVTRACREDMNNGDAWISQTLFSFIYGRRPLEPQPQRPQPPQPRQQQPRQQRPPPRGRAAQTPADAVPPTGADALFGRQGTLDFDLNMLRRDFFRERFTRQDYQTVNNQKVTYMPGRDVLCLLVWQAEETTDPNRPGAVQRPPVESEREFSAVSAADSRYSLDAQRAYFKALKDALASKNEVKFVEINANSAAAAEQAIREHTSTVPLVAASDPQSGAMPFTRLHVPVPFMALIDTEGQVKYAGVAAGFMPAFILTHMTGAAIDLATFQPTAGPMEPDTQRMYGRMPFDPNEPQRPYDPNHVPLRSDGDRLTQVRDPRQYRQLSAHERADAEKQIAFARDFFMNAARRGVISYKSGVDTCVEIIRKYPNTQYAEEARQLLLQVPEQQRQRYIDDAQIGR